MRSICHRDDGSTSWQFVKQISVKSDRQNIACHFAHQATLIDIEMQKRLEHAMSIVITNGDHIGSVSTLEKPHIEIGLGPISGSKYVTRFLIDNRAPLWI